MVPTDEGESALALMRPHAWWLVPAEPSLQHLRQVIEQLAAQTGGPVFEPHLTLALSRLPDGLDWDVLSRQLQRRLQALRLSAGTRGQTEHYFQTLFIRFGDSAEALAALDAQRRELAAVLDAAVAAWVAGNAGAVESSAPSKDGGTRPSGQGWGTAGGSCFAERAPAVNGTSASVRSDAIDGMAAAASSPTSTWAPAFEPHMSLCYAQLPAGYRQALTRRPCIAGEPLCFDTLVGVRPRAGAQGLGRVADWDCFLRIPLSVVNRQLRRPIST
ncbi:MAG: hypothetical protein Q4A16_03445 [Lautropia sp.]|nr:hypothetical protein [Lautropia sp.]